MSAHASPSTSRATMTTTILSSPAAGSNGAGSPPTTHQHASNIGTPEQHHRRLVSRHNFVADLSQCLLDFVIQLLPTAEELAVKEDVRKLLERLIRTIEPNSRLLSFGSTANGFSLRNSDMDLCCLIDDEKRPNATQLVNVLGDLLERETKFHVKPLPHARIPIVKLSLDPSPGLPLGIACDIGFENRLALENTRLLMCYAMIDPARVRTLVLFLKVWSKRRKINSPYKGTLSSYGYVLLVIYFLVHVKNPPVLPNLQQIPPLRPIPHEEHHLNNHDIWFFDDIELLRTRWQSLNTQTVGELLIDIFKYYSRDFSYNTGVASIRAGLLKKDSKGWHHHVDPRRPHDSREMNRLSIEDPFETDYNVARCVTKDGLYMIRGEFMRASRILSARPERAIMALGQLCEERADDPLAPVSSPPFIPPPQSLPPQTPFPVGSNPTRNAEAPVPLPDKLSPKAARIRPPPATKQDVVVRSPPEHMAPRRGKWTSPPPPEAPSADHTQYENRLGLGLSLATSWTDAREAEGAYLSSSSNSEILTDDDRAPSDVASEDDIRSVRSFGGEPISIPRQIPSPVSLSASVPYSMPIVEEASSSKLRQMAFHADIRFDNNATPTAANSGGRGRRQHRNHHDNQVQHHQSATTLKQIADLASNRHNYNTKRSISGPSRPIAPSAAYSSPVSATMPPSPIPSTSQTSYTRTTVYYETTPQQYRTRAVPSYPTPQSPMGPYPTYPNTFGVAGRTPIDQNAPQQQQQQQYSPIHIPQRRPSQRQQQQQQQRSPHIPPQQVPQHILDSAGSISFNSNSQQSSPSRSHSSQSISHQHNSSTNTIIAPSSPHHVAPPSQYTANTPPPEDSTPSSPLKPMQGPQVTLISGTNIPLQSRPSGIPSPSPSPPKTNNVHNKPADLSRQLFSKASNSLIRSSSISPSSPLSSSSSPSDYAGSISPASPVSPQSAAVISPVSLSPLPASPEVYPHSHPHLTSRSPPVTDVAPRQEKAIVMQDAPKIEPIDEASEEERALVGAVKTIEITAAPEA